MLPSWTKTCEDVSGTPIAKNAIGMIIQTQYSLRKTTYDPWVGQLLYSHNWLRNFNGKWSDPACESSVTSVHRCQYCTAHAYGAALKVSQRSQSVWREAGVPPPGMGTNQKTSRPMVTAVSGSIRYSETGDVPLPQRMHAYLQECGAFKMNEWITFTQPQACVTLVFPVGWCYI